MKSLDIKKVVLGMSGGVDSSVAACLLQRQGYRVYGLSMLLYSCENPLAKGCCTPKDRLDAREICESLEIPFEIVDLRRPFREKVMRYFASEYSKGRTPLPCAPCNKEIRFQALLDYADQVGAHWIATGHYAAVRQEADGRFSLLRAKDPSKDQSYFLWGLGQKELSRLQFPIGSYLKEEIRALAREFQLPVREKAESQDLCFVGDEAHAAFLEAHFPEATFPAGDFVDEAGKKLGRHRGLHAYTVGQRRGLGVSVGERRYVAKLDPEKNAVILGQREALQARGLLAKDLYWISGEFSKADKESIVRIRSTHPGVAAYWETRGEETNVAFETPQFAVTPGQAAVFYQGDRCLGGGWIERAVS